MSTGKTTVSLTKVLSTCVDAARLGCLEIRAVQQRRDAKQTIDIKLKDENDAKSALTEADLAAQNAIVTALRESWPGIHIIGEEDESSPEGAPAALSSAPPSLRSDLCTAAGDDCELFLPLDELTVFVDPLDGTREFVEGRLDAVQSLVGIAVGGRAVAGAIGLPFPTGAMAKEPVVLYAVSEGGVVGTLGDVPSPPPAAPPSPSADRPLITTGDSSNTLLATARSAALRGGGSALILGGAGNKLRAVAEGHADVAIMHFGTSLWDSCAPEALLKAKGGRVTDLLGAPLVHSRTPPSGDLLNSLGVIASAKGYSALHDELCAQMRREPAALALLERYIGAASGSSAAAAPFAADVARSLDGGVLSRAWLDGVLRAASSGMEGEAVPRLAAYSAPDDAAFRGMMSDGCRLTLEWEGTDGDGTAAVGEARRTVFYKRVVMGDLESTRLKAKSAPKKLLRDVKSYGVEAAFLGSRACAALAESGVRVPRAFHVEQRPNDASPIDSKFSMLLADFDPADGWRQEGALTTSQVKVTLATLARFHAFFWAGASVWSDDSTAKELEGGVWAAGGYWQPSMQTQEQFDKLAEKYIEHSSSFGEVFDAAPELAGVSDVRSVGARLQSVARDVSAKAHPFDREAAPSGPAAYGRFRTIIHGDPKAANLFLKGGQSDLEIGLIDFQWTGFGLAATDCAHHLCAAAIAPECLTVDGSTEQALLDHYHTKLCAALAEAGAAESAASAAERLLTRSELQTQYEDAVLDMGRIVFSYQWSRAKFDGKPNLNRNAYNKNANNAAWLVARCDALLKARGV